MNSPMNTRSIAFVGAVNAIRHGFPLSNDMLTDLCAGWANPGWQATPEYLRECVEWTLAGQGAILECGSGLSTVVIGAAAEAAKRMHYAFEHDPWWWKRVRAELDFFGIPTTLRFAPLRRYGKFDWYNIALGMLPKSFTLVVCDGPPGATFGGRAGLVPLTRSRLWPGTVILLDDAARDAENALALAWQKELDAMLSISKTPRPFARLVVDADHGPEWVQNRARMPL